MKIAFDILTGPGMILFVAGIYLMTAYGLFTKNNYGMALTFFSYAMANVGLYWVSKYAG